ncbi:MAG: hypothetical protein ACXVRM_09305 [Solirubrobacteraceae bacterium]
MQDWRAFRPAIWLAMLGVALILVIQPAYFGAALLGAAIGVAIRIEMVRRRAARSAPPRARRRG